MFNEKYTQLKSELAELEANFNNPSVASDTEKMRDLGKRYSEIKDFVNDLENWKKQTAELAENEKLLTEEKEDLEMKKMLEEEIAKQKEALTTLENKINKSLVPPDPNNGRNAILEIRAGAGGDEASLFAGDLFRMYALYGQNNNWKIEVLNHHRNEVGGYKEIIAFISGKNIYKILKHESGVHRVQRIPTTEKSGRIHTSTATVAAMPEAEATEIEINPNDIRIDVFRSSGPGGQSVNMTDSAVRITHLPSGITVSCQDQKSQHKNKEKAMKVLSARLLAFEEEKKRKETEDLRSSQVGSGDRSEKIRTYNYPQNRVTDHRLNKSWHNLDRIMEGEISDIINSFE
ncbi:MAG: peptide chain release factor 1 [Candidatus Moraniibacteriota bacterium]